MTHAVKDVSDFESAAFSSQDENSNRPRNPDPLLTVPEAAEYLHLPEGTLRQQIRARRLATVKLSARGIRVRQSELERYIATLTRPVR